MALKAYTIDMVDIGGEGGAYFKEMLQKYGRSTKIIDIVGFCRPGHNAILDMMDKVIAAAEGQYGSIGSLALWGHGLVDADHKPIGIHAFTGGWADEKYGYQLTMKLLDDLGTRLERLRGYFDTSGRFEIRGCGAAVGPGLEVMKKLAEKWQVEVHGSEANSMGLSWAPPVKAVSPDGTSRTIAGIEYDKR